MLEAAIIGGGSWGSAFALHLGRLRIKTRFWVREGGILEELFKTRQNSVFRPGHVFPLSVSFSADLKETDGCAEALFIAVPSQFCRQVFSDIAPAL